MKRFSIFLLFFLILNLNTLDVFAGTIKGKISASRLKSPKDILVYIDKIDGEEFTPPEKPEKMDQSNLVFIPRVLPVLVGTTVEFHNNDDLKHNVFGVGDDDFDLGVWTKGIVKTHTFNNLGEAAILCNVHPEMEAYIPVLQNPYFALTNEEGNYKIEDVPSGLYILKTWHDRLRSVKEEVEVSEADEVTVDFQLKR